MAGWEDEGGLKQHNNNEIDTDCGWAGRVGRVIGSRVASRESRGVPKICGESTADQASGTGAGRVVIIDSVKSFLILECCLTEMVSSYSFKE